MYKRQAIQREQHLYKVSLEPSHKNLTICFSGFTYSDPAYMSYEYKMEGMDDCLLYKSPVRTTVYLRYPSWSKNAEVLVNGNTVAVKQKTGSYIAITRDWKDNDRISATYPLQIELEATPDNPNKVALLYAGQ